MFVPLCLAGIPQAQLEKCFQIALIPQEQGYWGPVIKENSVYVADPASGESSLLCNTFSSMPLISGATMIDIALGHQMDSLIHVLGDFASVSATARTYYRVGTVVHNDNQPTGKTLENKAPDHVAFTGILKSGAIASITMCAGHPSTPGRRQLLWEIDGELGTISMEGDARTLFLPHETHHSDRRSHSWFCVY